MGESSSTTQHVSPGEIADKLSGPMVMALKATTDTAYGKDYVTGNSNTMAALVARGLVTPGIRYHYLTDLGRRVAHALGINVLLIDELHAEALAEDAERFPYSGNDGDLTAEQAIDTTHDPLRADIDQAIDRLIRAAKYRALSEVIKSLDRWVDAGPTAMTNTQRAKYAETAYHAVNYAADAMGVRKPWTPAP